MPVHQLDHPELTEDAVWLDVECGPLSTDLEYWLMLAERGDTVVDVGAGVGRVSIPLARAGHDVIAVEIDPAALFELRLRAQALGLVFDAALQDARDLWLPRQVELVIVPCSTLQLLGPRSDRARFLERAAHWLKPGGRLVVALHDNLEPWQADGAAPEPDVLERNGCVYASRLVAVEKTREWMDLVWERTIEADGVRSAPVRHVDRLWRCSPRMLAIEARRFGLALHRFERRFGGTREDALIVELRKGC